MSTEHEHEEHRSLTEDIFYPDHSPRKESHTFVQTKHKGHSDGLRCAISGRKDKVEYHHVFIEWAFSDAVDWVMVKDIALGKVKELPVLDLDTDQPDSTGETYPVEQSLIYSITKITAARGFDWESFDPERPETFVDSIQNMLVLHEKFHRARYHGIHEETYPVWGFQAFPRKAGFVYSPDELKEKHNNVNSNT